MAKLGAMVSGAYTQTLRSQNQLAMEYQREIIRAAGHKTRKDNDFEHQQNVLNDLDRRRASGSPIEQAFGVRYTTGYDPKPTPDKDKPGTPPKGGKSKRSKGGSIAATVGAVKSGNIDFEQATGGEFGDEAGISPKLTADFGAHAAAGGNKDTYLAQFTPSGRRKRSKPSKPNTPPPPGGGGSGGSATASATATATKKPKPAGSSNPTTGNSGNGNKK